MPIPNSLAKLLIFATATCLVASFVIDGRVPTQNQISEHSRREPLQEAPTKLAYKTVVQSVEYTIEPKANYDIAGVIVSMHHSNTWWDWIHASWNDHINVADLCMVWGNNVASDNYRKLDYSSGQFTCNVQTGDSSIWNAFDMTALSNNHVLTDDRHIAKQLLNLRVGDQIRIRGTLVDYSHTQGGGFKRTTSLVRTDQGNGACETLFVDSLDMIKAAPRTPQNLRWLGSIGLILSLLIWIFLTPVGIPD